MINKIKPTDVLGIQNYSCEDLVKKTTSSDKRPASSTDTLNLSNQSKLMEMAFDAPELDQQEKVASIKQAITQGQYDIDLDKLAKAIMNHYQ